jgi:hypothetical protein
MKTEKTMEMSEGTEAVKEVKQFLEKVRPDLTITDVPKETLDWFKEFTNSDEFRCSKNKSGHYGFALKFLCDFFRGKLPMGLEGELEELSSRLDSMEKPEMPVKKLLNGAELKLGG